jgi:hypothetical protein
MCANMDSAWRICMFSVTSVAPARGTCRIRILHLLDWSRLLAAQVRSHTCFHPQARFVTLASSHALPNAACGVLSCALWLACILVRQLTYQLTYLHAFSALLVRQLTYQLTYLRAFSAHPCAPADIPADVLACILACV